MYKRQIINEVVFEIYPLLKSQTIADHSLRLGFTVKNLDKLMVKLKEQGIEILSEPKQSDYGYIAIICDLDGRKIELKDKNSDS